jgi:hypothetical protein
MKNEKRRWRLAPGVNEHVIAKSLIEDRRLLPI